MSERRQCIADQIGLHMGHAFAVLRTTTTRLSDATETIAIEWYKDLRGDIIINGRNPKAIAAALVYWSIVAAGDNIVQAEVAEIMGVGHTTIRSNILLLKSRLKIPPLHGDG